MYWLRKDIISEVWRLHLRSCIWCVPGIYNKSGHPYRTKTSEWYFFKDVNSAFKFYCKQNPKPFAWQPCEVCNP